LRSMGLPIRPRTNKQAGCGKCRVDDSYWVRKKLETEKEATNGYRKRKAG
jgi:hypothetical protein